MSNRKQVRATVFPTSFSWGAASSAFQIEGGATADLRGPSIWDTFCRRAGSIHGGHHADVACDHFHRFADDVELMQRMGLRAYRFSIAWPRVLPTGRGAVHEAGLAFYERLVDALLAAGIEPWATLYHWELPDALQQRGGWQNREIAEWFAEYAGVVTARLSDRVNRWITLNEPQIFIGLGLGQGIHAPGLKLSVREQLAAAHHALLAHGQAVQRMRAVMKRPGQIGWAPAVRVNYPATESAADIDAARRATLAVLKPDMWNTAWFADPIHLGRYPDDGLRCFGADAPRVHRGDMDVIQQPVDFLGVNIYSGTRTANDTSGEAVTVDHPIGCPRSALNWPVAPESLRWGPRFLWERYGSPIVVTENGMSNLDWVDLDGRVRDPQRIDYTRRYLLELERAITDGTDVRGYFHWSLLDNFEWAEGYKDRFGLVYVDYATQQRVLKDSAHWYRRVIETNGASLRESGDVPVMGANPVGGETAGEDRPSGSQRLNLAKAANRG
ncbi:MAG: beta-glucosidase [Phycisphaerales bacterium]|nr:beta-glucosidase [Phycisphaerales bacterium]